MLTLQSLAKQPTGNRDASGFEVFAAGQAGQAHVVVHRMLDRDRHDLGHRFLGAWLRERSGSGSEWIHLQWHMAVFELELGHWRAALSRFQDHILPAATTTEDALTDGPALLWRLMLASPAPVTLPWEPVRARALARMHRPSSPYVELHHLLALAGASDFTGIDRWLHTMTRTARSRVEALVVQMTTALRAFATGEYRRCTALLATTLPHIGEIGGSRAQNQLFSQLDQMSRAKAGIHPSPLPIPKAA